MGKLSIHLDRLYAIIASKSLGRALRRRTTSTRCGLGLLSLVMRCPPLLSLLCMCSGTFRMEIRAALAGQHAYYSSLLAGNDSIPLYTLRRNIHRIEKGLSMRSRRIIFAADYIGETVDILHQLIQLEGALPSDARHFASTTQWSVDVLAEYFGHVGRNEEISRAKERFDKVVTSHSITCGTMHPQTRELPAALPVSYDALMRLAWQRRSIRFYEDRAVPRALIDQAIDVARLSPSACNRQAFAFRIYDDPHLIRTLAKIPGGMTGFADQVPCLIVLVGDLGAYFHERDRHVIYIDGSLAAMSFLYALETLGLSSCCVNWPNTPKNDATIANTIGLLPQERVVMLISVGFPARNNVVPYSGKKDLSEIRSYNRT